MAEGYQEQTANRQKGPCLGTAPSNRLGKLHSTQPLAASQVLLSIPLSLASGSSKGYPRSTPSLHRFEIQLLPQKGTDLAKAIQ